MTKSRGINKPRHRWIAVEVDTLRRLYPDQTAEFISRVLGIALGSVYRKAKDMGLEKSEAFMASDRSGRIIRGRKDPRMAATQFKPGSVPPNKGVKGIHLSPRTEFKPGCVSPNTQEVGALRINTLGDIDIKVAPGKNQWVSLRRYVWEMAHGPIPPGMCIGMKNHDPHDTQLDNLLLLTRAENIAHNLLRRYPKELRNTMALTGRIRNRIQQIQGEQHA